jgi:hypothetical protein
MAFLVGIGSLVVTFSPAASFHIQIFLLIDQVWNEKDENKLGPL